MVLFFFNLADNTLKIKDASCTSTFGIVDKASCISVCWCGDSLKRLQGKCGLNSVECDLNQLLCGLLLNWLQDHLRGIWFV